jgi:hypothetical protein
MPSAFPINEESMQVATHQITLLAQSVAPLAVSMTISSTAFAALVGRLALARFADEINARVTTAPYS